MERPPAVWLRSTVGASAPAVDLIAERVLDSERILLDRRDALTSCRQTDEQEGHSPVAGTSVALSVFDDSHGRDAPQVGIEATRRWRFESSSLAIFRVRRRSVVRKRIPADASYQLHRFDIGMEKDASRLEAFPNGSSGEVVAIVPHIKKTTLAQIYGVTRKVDVLLVVEPAKPSPPAIEASGLQQPGPRHEVDRRRDAPRPGSPWPSRVWLVARTWRSQTRLAFDPGAAPVWGWCRGPIRCRLGSAGLLRRG